MSVAWPSYFSGTHVPGTDAKAHPKRLTLPLNVS